MILLRRYGLPLLFAVGLYSILYALFGLQTNYLNAGLFMSLLFSYLIRVTDDIGDYAKDRAKGSAVLSKKALTVLAVGIGTALLLLILLFGLYLMFIPLVIIAVQLLIRERLRDWIKPLFLPSIVLTLVYSVFTADFRIYIIAALLIVLDVLLILYKKRKRSHL